MDSPHCHDQYRTALDLPDELTLLSDFNKEFGSAYGILTDSASGFKGVLRRTAFVIDQDGKVVYRWETSPDQPLPNPQEVLEAVRKVGNK